ncbi:hypothetical protein Y032_0143g2413 [Ancylostoma ceylanicum]|uniref:SCP domain-containing protein n=1 Tax=Ancylostoma ceylanicum TaxID=53326 RepID=A0A016T2E2_9BILA|nr:hypothetical protein Y032_0143g2413 [Ancylostoma ceylanicum]
MRFCTLAITFALVVALSLVEGMPVPNPFGCKNALISDNWREYVLNFHNDKRRRLSQGIQVSKGGNAPGAKDMNELSWDCDLEHHAWSGVCDGTVDKNTYGVIEDTFATKKDCNVTEKISAILKKWWNEVKEADFSQNVNYGAAYPNFRQMAVGKAKGFACTYRPCTNSQSKFLCIYNEKAGTDPIYMKAGNAQEICQCTNQGKDCIDYLCQIDYTPVGDIPTRVCTAKDGMNSDLETIATDMHNYYRRLVATGWAKDKKDGYAPTAKDMYALKYTDCQAPDTIAEDTKAKVTGCPSTAPQADPGRSLNYYYVTKYNIPREQLLQEAISKWMKQLEDVGVGKTNIFDENAGVTYYANMVHDKVEKFACAVDVCDKTGNSAVICQYNAIPTDGDPIYELGKPCKCTGGRQCSPLQGLCVVP